MNAAKLCVVHGISDFRLPQPTEWQRTENEIDTAMIFARADFVSHRSGSMVVSSLGRVAQTNQSVAR